MVVTRIDRLRERRRIIGAAVLVKVLSIVVERERESEAVGSVNCDSVCFGGYGFEFLKLIFVK